MEIVTRGHEWENGVRQIMQLFFSLEDDIKVTSTLSNLNAEAEILFDGKSYKATASSEKDERLYLTNAVKRAVFYAAKKISNMPAPWGISTGIRPAKGARKMLDDKKTEDEIAKHLTQEYLMDENKARLAIDVAKKEQGILAGMPKNSVSIYVGIPFCPTRCSYCSFISQATAHNNKFIEPYVNALIKEIEYTGKRLKETCMQVDSVYFGGGTPTAIPVDFLKRLIEKLKEAFDLGSVREFTVEAGRPDTFSKELVDMLCNENVGRISINPQTMHVETLKKIGRGHSVEDIKKAFYLAHEAGIKSINADLIAGLPDEDAAMMEYSVEEVLKLKPHAVTVHTLYMKRAADMIDEFSKIRFASHAGEMMDRSVNLLNKKQMSPYYMYKQRNTLGNLENVGFAKEGHESLYNVYIMEEVQPIIALGAGGSTKMVSNGEIERVFNPKEAADYTQRIEEVLRRKDMFFKFYENKKEEK